MTHRCIATASLEENNIVNCRGVAGRVQLSVHSSATVIMTDLGKYFSWHKKSKGCIITSEPCPPLQPDHMGPARSRKDKERFSSARFQATELETLFQLVRDAAKLKKKKNRRVCKSGL